MLNVLPSPRGSRKKVESSFFSVALVSGTAKPGVAVAAAAGNVSVSAGVEYVHPVPESSALPASGAW